MHMYIYMIYVYICAWLHICWFVAASYPSNKTAHFQGFSRPAQTNVKNSLAAPLPHQAANLSVRIKNQNLLHSPWCRIDDCLTNVAHGPRPSHWLWPGPRHAPGPPYGMVLRGWGSRRHIYIYICINTYIDIHLYILKVIQPSKW